MTVFAGIALHAHPLVPVGSAWVIDGAALWLLPGVAAPSAGPLVYLHPDTLQRVQLMLWAKQRTDEVITAATVQAVLALCCNQGAP